IYLADHFPFIGERSYCHHRSENLLAPAAVGLANIQQDGWFQVIAFRVKPPASGGDNGLATARVLEKPLDRGALSGRNQWPKLSLRLARITNNQLLRRGYKLLHEPFVDTLFHEDPAARTTILPGIGEDAHRRGLGGAFPIAVRKNDIG